MPNAWESTALSADDKSLVRWRLAIVVLVGLVAARDIGQAGFGFPDASRHAMDGVLFWDMLRDGGYTQPIEFTKQFYGRYPCLGFPFHYPPLFALSEVPFFALFGLSSATARLCVLCWHVGAVLLLFEIGRRVIGLTGGVLAALFFATSPVVLEWSRQVMLEAPTTCMLLLATWLLLRWEEQPGVLRAWFWAAALVGALLSKQTAIFIIGAHALYLLARWRSVRSSWRQLMLPLATALACAGLYMFLSWRHSIMLTSAIEIKANSAAQLFGRLTGYPRLLPEVLGWPQLILAGLGLLWVWAAKADRKSILAMLSTSWIIAFYAMSSLFDWTDPRHGYIWAAPFSLAAGYSMQRIISLEARRWLQAGIIAAAAAWPLFQTLFSRPYIVWIRSPSLWPFCPVVALCWSIVSTTAISCFS